MKLYSFQAHCGETDWVAANSKEEAKKILIEFQEGMADDGEYDGVEGVEIPESEWEQHTMTDFLEYEEKEITFKEAIKDLQVPAHIASTLFG